MDKLNVHGREITVSNLILNEDYICITDIAKHKDELNPRFIIQNWMRNRNTVEFLGIWELLYNPNFNRVEFEAVRTRAGLNSFVMTPRQWREENPDLKGNIRDYANVAQLVCLLNLENLNSVFILENISQSERLQRLNLIAINQMKILADDRRILALESNIGNGDLEKRS